MLTPSNRENEVCFFFPLGSHVPSNIKRFYYCRKGRNGHGGKGTMSLHIIFVVEADSCLLL